MLQSVAVPDSLSEVHRVLSGKDASALIAGGTVLMPVVNGGTDDIKNLVSLRRAGLSGIAIEGGKATIGAATPLAAIENNDALAFLWPALDAIASPTIRNMATVGGNLFAKAPYGDFAACLIALGAAATISGPGGERIEPVERTVAGIGTGEVVTHLSFVLPAAGAFRFAKAGRKALNSAAVVTVAAVVEVAGGSVAACRIGLGGVAKHVVRAVSAEAALNGRPFDRAHVEAAAEAALTDIDPADDAYASAWYRRRVTPVHIRRALLGQ
jgi:CO/xanthine dehydrogenase FAD-binding subunit